MVVTESKNEIRYCNMLHLLEEGKKDVVIKFTNGEAKTSLTIEKAAGNNIPAGPGGNNNASPQTGESSLPEMLLFIIGISAAGLVVFSRKREENR